MIDTHLKFWLLCCVQILVGVTSYIFIYSSKVPLTAGTMKVQQQSQTVKCRFSTLWWKTLQWFYIQRFTFFFSECRGNRTSDRIHLRWCWLIWAGRFMLWNANILWAIYYCDYYCTQKQISVLILPCFMNLLLCYLDFPVFECFLFWHLSLLIDDNFFQAQ